MKYWTGFLLLILLLIPCMWSLAFDNTQAVNCQIDLSAAVTALQAAQQAIDKGDMDTALHTVGEARNVLQLLEAQCADYAPDTAGNSRTNPVPFGQRQHAEMGNKFSGSIELIEYIDNAEDYIRQVRTDSDTDPAPEGKRYIVFRLKYACEKPTSESCDFSRGYFSAVGDKGLVYDYSSIKSRFIIPVGDDQEIFGGTEIEVDVPFLVDDADSNVVLFTDYGNVSRVFFASNSTDGNSTSLVLPANGFGSVGNPVTHNADWMPIEKDFDGVIMAQVPTGCFNMGSNDGDSSEQPVNKQCFDTPFWIDKYEVKQSDFALIGGVKANSNRFIGDKRPVEQITWLEARKFCEDSRQMRLPTEAEWEYAARGPDNLIYPWGNTWNENNVVWSGNSGDQTAEVGSHPAGASWVGALDMSGNVWEWVSTLYQPYPFSAVDGREADTGSKTDVHRVLRGGSWGYEGDDGLRVSYRNWSNADLYSGLQDGGYGFRCARSF